MTIFALLFGIRTFALAPPLGLAVNLMIFAALVVFAEWAYRRLVEQHFVTADLV